MKKKIARLKLKISIVIVLIVAFAVFLLLATAVAAVCSILPSANASSDTVSDTTSNAAPVDVSGLGISNNLISFLESWEGYAEYPECGEDSWNSTIGYGHVIRNNEHITELSKDEAQALMIHDLKSDGFITWVRSEFSTTKLTQNQIEALVSLAYNIGTSDWDNLDLTGDVKRGADADTLKKDFESICYVGDKKSAGLLRRRTAEWVMFTQGKYELNQ